MGLEWADQSHEIRLHTFSSSNIESFNVEQKPEVLHRWIAQFRVRFPQGRIAEALQQPRRAVIYTLMNYGFLFLYPIPRKGLAHYREAFATTGAKERPDRCLAASGDSVYAS